ncbi:MAG: hypothetical protein ACYC63_17410 [Armatimonadota bacterium]
MKVGFSAADITPAFGMEIPGGFSKAYHAKFHDNCFATAMVIEQDGERVALVGLDTLSVKGGVVRDARRMIEEKCGLPAANIMVGASHSHASGPIVGAFPGDFAQSFDPDFCEDLAQNQATSANPDYCRQVSRAIAHAVITADQNKEDATLSIGTGEERTVAFNRRFWMKNGKQNTHPGKGNPDIVKPAGPVDPEVGVLGAWRPDGSFLGCLINFTCHGTTGNGGTSSDWIHWLRETVKGGMGGGHVVFLNGACGDITQINNLDMEEGEYGEKWSRRVGQKVGAEALKVLSMAERAELAPLAAKQTYVKIETRKVSEELFQEALSFFKSDPPPGWDRWLARDLILLHEHNKWEPQVTAEVQAIQVGPAVFLSNGSEYFCQFGLNIKHRSQFPFTFVVELANQSIGYIPTPEAMGPNGGGYEPVLCMSSKLIPEAGQMIEDASVELAGSLTPGEVPPAPQAPKAGVAWDVNTSKMATV